MTERPPPSLRNQRLTRERLARLKAEAIAEQGLRELFQRQQEIQLLRATAEAANSARSIAEAMQSALEAICAHTKWPLGHYCAVAADSFDDERPANPSDIWHVARDLPDGQAVKEAARVLAGRLGLSTRVHQTGAPVWIEDVTTVAGPPGDDATAPPAIRAAFALPVLAGREVAAVLEFYAPALTPDDHLAEICSQIGVQLGRVVERERARAETIDAYHDPLTRLPNRALFLRFVQRALKRQERYAGAKFAVLFIDLDKFKAINDSLGHRAGDELLEQLAHRLTESLRATDPVARVDPMPPGLAVAENAVARLGGDEFTILLEDIHDVSDAIRVADRIHAALAQPFILDPGVEVFVGASIGIASTRPGHDSAEDVLQDADIAMYRAKSSGKRRTEVFDQEMHREAVARLQLETDLQHALERGELALAYQPIVRLETGAITGFEALLRWHHPTRGVLVPSEFIAVAEDNGTILEIGSWALEEACRQLLAWHQRFGRDDLTMAVNLSAKQFGLPDLVGDVAQILRTTGIAPARLCLELTESVAMEHAAQSERKLWDLHELGVVLTIDDFGTGYSSLAYLTRFRVNSLKIDRSFVRGLGIETGEALVRAVLSIGVNLGLQVVAEGVENAEEAARLVALGCVFAQGYHFHRPLWPDDVEPLLEPGQPGA